MSEQQQSRLAQAAFYTAFGSAASILFSIAVSNILLALSLAALLLSGEKLRFPPIKLPLGLFMLGTVLSLAFSDNPWAGRVQVRKFLVFLMLLIVFSAFRHLRQVRLLIMAFTVLGALSAARALMQFAWQLKECGSSYGCLVGERITGFMSHWMTFGAHMMIVLMLLAAFLFWATPPNAPWGCGSSAGFSSARLSSPEARGPSGSPPPLPGRISSSAGSAGRSSSLPWPSPWRCWPRRPSCGSASPPFGSLTANSIPTNTGASSGVRASA